LKAKRLFSSFGEEVEADCHYPWPPYWVIWVHMTCGGRDGRICGGHCGGEDDAAAISGTFGAGCFFNFFILLAPMS